MGSRPTRGRGRPGEGGVERDIIEQMESSGRGRGRKKASPVGGSAASRKGREVKEEEKEEFEEEEEDFYDEEDEEEDESAELFRGVSGERGGFSEEVIGSKVEAPDV